MTGFLERRKKWALPAWFSRAGVLVLVVVAAATAFVLVAPPDYTGFRFGRLGDLPFAKKQPMAKQSGGISAAAPTGIRAASSVDFVRSSAVLAARQAVRSITDVLSLQESQRSDWGLNLADEDLTGERARQARGPYANPGFFSGKTWVGERQGEKMARALAGIETPRVAAGRVRDRSSVRISPAKAAKILRGSKFVVARNFPADGPGAVAQLALGRENGELARRRPLEGAAAGSGSVYDGNPAGARASGGQAVSADPASLARVPGPGLEDAARKAEADVLKCRQADQFYDSREARLSADFARKSEALANAGCASSGGRCGGLVQEARNACRLYNDERCRHIMACPLTASDGCASFDCTLVE